MSAAINLTAENSAVSWPTPVALDPRDAHAIEAHVNDWITRYPYAVGFDIETTGLDPFRDAPVTLQWGNTSEAYYVDVRTLDAMQALRLGRALTRFFDGSTLLVGHNLAFDLGWMISVYDVDVREARVYDTMIAEQVILSGRLGPQGQSLSASLQATAARYGFPVSKQERSYFFGLHNTLLWAQDLPPEQVAYLGQDVAMPIYLLRGQRSRITNADLYDTNALEQGLVPHLARIAQHGVCVDVPGWKAYIAARRAEADHLAKRIILEFLAPALGKSVNLNSPKQVMAALVAMNIRDRSGHQVIPTSTDHAELERLKDTHEVFRLMLDWRRVNKLVIAFGDAVLGHACLDRATHWRIHPTIRQIGARSGRMACADPNWQQLPSHQVGEDTLRHHVIAPPGRKLLIADFSNIEARVLAELSQDRHLLDLFAGGGDLHAETARLMFGLDSTTDPATSTYQPGLSYRNAAKTINYALMFGMGSKHLAQSLGVTPLDAKDLMSRYFAAYPDVRRYLDRMGAQGIANRESRTLLGRRRIIDIPAAPAQSSYASRVEFLLAKEQYELNLGLAQRQAINSPVQGTAADIMKLAVLWLAQVLPGQAYITSIVHDELVVECLEEHVPRVRRQLAITMQRAMRHVLATVAAPLPDVIVADYWRKE